LGVLPVKNVTSYLPIQQDQLIIDGKGGLGLSAANARLEVNQPSGRSQ
jgi:hypothetical protein